MLHIGFHLHKEWREHRFKAGRVSTSLRGWTRTGCLGSHVACALSVSMYRLMSACPTTNLCGSLEYADDSMR